MPNYYFVVQWPDRTVNNPGWTILPDDAAATAYARRLIRELKLTGGYDNPDLTLLIQNAERQTIASIPFRDVR